LSNRDAFLQRVRQAVKDGNRAGAAPPLPECGTVGYQGAGADPVARFCAELKAAGGCPHVVEDEDAAWRIIHEILSDTPARKIVVSRGGLVEGLNLDRLKDEGFDVTTVDAFAGMRDIFFAADVGISNVEYLIAEAGSVVVASGANEPRSLSLLPPVHIALASRGQLLADLFDLFERMGATPQEAMPSCLTLITGPSKTGDIELRLVTGVHGPGQVHVVLVEVPPAGRDL
jgi:L-lactate dehydrogenase complex protein LldG